MIDICGKKRCEYCFEEMSGENDTCEKCRAKRNEYTYKNALSTGSILNGRYIVGKVLGQGGFGISYCCFDTRDECKVAIKECFPSDITERSSDGLMATVQTKYENSFENGKKKFYDEAVMISRFNGNPNIVNVKELFYENDTVYYVMEYLEGVDLKNYVAKNGDSLSAKESLRIISQICDALIIIHSVGILHRDIAPDNIFMCTDGKIKLIDFGAARLIVGAETKSLTIILKPGFAPFEQYQSNGSFGAWTDIYALGATYYYCLTGKKLLDSPSRVDDPNIDFSFTDETTAAILSKMLAVRIRDRYQSAIELKNDLFILEKELNSIEPEDVPEAADKKTDVNKVPSSGGLISALKKSKKNRGSDQVSGQVLQKKPAKAPKIIFTVLWTIAFIVALGAVNCTESNCSDIVLLITSHIMPVVMLVPLIIFILVANKRAAAENIKVKNTKPLFIIGVVSSSLAVLFFVLFIVLWVVNRGRIPQLVSEIFQEVLFLAVVTLEIATYKTYGCLPETGFDNEKSLISKVAMLTALITFVQSLAMIIVTSAM